MVRAEESLRHVERFFQFSMLGLVVSGFLALAGSGTLDTVSIALASAGLLARAASAAGWLRGRIPPRAVTVATLAYMGFYPLDLQYLSREFLPATVHLVVFLAVVKVLTAETPRDYLYTSLIAFLELLAATLLSSSPAFFACLGFFLLFAIASFTAAEIRRSSGARAQVAGLGRARLAPRLATLSVFIAFGILSITAVLFFLLPRTANAAFRHLVSQRYHLPGFSNEVTLGQIGELKARSTAVMHVRFYNPRGQYSLKWRGGALAEFDGRRWFNSSADVTRLRIPRGQLILADDTQRRRQGQRIGYRIDLEYIGSDAVFFAGIPEVIGLNQPMLLRTPTDAFRFAMPRLDPVRYDAYSFLPVPGVENGAIVYGLSPESRELYLRLPRIDPRIAPLAAELTRDAQGRGEQARLLEKRLRERYRYTLELPQTEPPDPVAYFLFERREGHCEYFAAAMAVMLRTLGIPSRLATGFQSGVWNPVSERYVVRASDAHSWVEAWIPGEGWTSFDPTPPDPTLTPGLLARMALYADAADTFWQEWVVGYNLTRQLTLADSVENSTRRWQSNWLGRLTSLRAPDLEAIRRTAGAWGLRIFPFALTLAAAWLLGPHVREAWRTRRRLRRIRSGAVARGDAEQLYLNLLRLLARRGYEKPAWYTAREFAQSLPSPALRALVERFAACYHEVRFGGRVEGAREMTVLLEQLQGMR